MSIPIPTSSIAIRFAQIIEGLRHMVPKFIAKDRNAGLLIILIWSHLGRLGRQFAALAARAEAGTLRTARRHTTGARRAATAQVPSGLPTGAGWLGDMMWEARGFGGYLQEMVLNDPEMAALIAASPQVGRIVRSILWMTSRFPVPVILRVSRPKRVRASPRPSRDGLPLPEVDGSGSVDGPTPPSRGEMKEGLVYSSTGKREVDPVPATKVGIREVRFWSQPRGKLRSTAGPRRVA